MIESNNLEEYIDMNKLEIKLLYDENLVLFFNSDLKFYLTLKCHKLANYTEEKLALLICHELSHYLLDHNSKRIIISYFHWEFFKKWFKSIQDNCELYDPRTEEFKERSKV